MRASGHHVVIVGGGFGGLYAAQALKRVDVRLTLVDRRNFHLFQPLLYQVAMGQLSPGDIASPLRTVLKHQRNTQVLMAEVVGIDAANRRLVFSDGELGYDTLILAAGSRHHYFGNEQWEPLAPGLKTIEDATEMRRRVLLAFEAAERESDAARRHAWMTFVVVGAGPTGVELAGALGEIANDTLRRDFRAITPSDAEIILLEAGERVLPPYVPTLSASAEAALRGLGVTVRNSTTVVGVDAEAVTVRQGERQERIPTRTVLWAAGVQASPLGRLLAESSGAKLDRAGRVIVEADLSVSGHPEILVIGDMAHFVPPGGQPLPAVAPVAMAQGRYVADLIARRLRGAAVEPFRYRDKGMLATIGRSKAVADLGFVRFSGFVAWLTWLFIHLMYLVGFRNRVLVLLQWAWSYATRNRGARLITGPNPLPLAVSRGDASETVEKKVY